MEKLGKKRREESGTVWYTFVCKELRYMKEQVLAVQRMQDYIAKHCAHDKHSVHLCDSHPKAGASVHHQAREKRRGLFFPTARR